MNADQALQEIIRQCEETDSFIFKLRMNNTFDPEQYQRLMDALSVYEQAIRGNELISRRVAGGLFYLVQILESMSAFFDQRALVDAGKVSHAHAEVWTIVERIITSPTHK